LHRCTSFEDQFGCLADGYRDKKVVSIVRFRKPRGWF
jgi:hypothetical protein